MQRAGVDPPAAQQADHGVDLPATRQEREQRPLRVGRQGVLDRRGDMREERPRHAPIVEPGHPVGGRGPDRAQRMRAGGHAQHPGVVAEQPRPAVGVERGRHDG